MGWGVSLLGFGAVLDALDDIQVQLDDDAVYVVGTNVEYAVYQEFGTRHQAGTPHLRPAAREAQRDVARIAAGAQSMDEVVKRVALAIEREAKSRAPVDTGNLKASYRTVKIR